MPPANERITTLETLIQQMFKTLDAVQARLDKEDEFDHHLDKRISAIELANTFKSSVWSFFLPYIISLVAGIATNYFIPK